MSTPWTPIPTVPTVTRPDGVQDTVNVLTTGQVPQWEYDISDTIYTKNARSAPFTWFLDQIGRKMGYTDEHMWYEQDSVPQRDTVDGSIASGAATITVDGVNKWTVNDTLWEPLANLQGIVTAVNRTTGVLTITWITPGVIIDGATVIRIGNAYDQYSTIELGPVSKEVQKSNYFQDMRHGRAITDVAKEDPVRVNQPYYDQVMQWAMWQHEIEKEKTLLFGAASYDTTGTHPRGNSRGLYNFLATNVTSVGAALTRSVWENFITNITAKNTHTNQNWVAFVSARIRIQISGFSQTYERTDTFASQFGMAVEKYKCPDGTVVTLVTHPLFHREGLDGLGFLINMDPEVTKYVHRTKFDTKRYKSILAHGLSAYEDFYRTVFTLECKGEEINGGVIEDVAAA
jgi:hypothetical protein